MRGQTNAWESVSNTKTNDKIRKRSNNRLVISGAALTVQFQGETQTTTMAASDLEDLAYESDSLAR